jgi:hypothetical protein
LQRPGKPLTLDVSISFPCHHEEKSPRKPLRPIFAGKLEGLSSLPFFHERVRATPAGIFSSIKFGEMGGSSISQVVDRMSGRKLDEFPRPKAGFVLSFFFELGQYWLFVGAIEVLLLPALPFSSITSKECY